ncbi:MAG TPA: PaaI family thioesterase [Thermohalobaculum sp.]|nr:PaaI family thioesterase [Thermohalobaculum sp.]
MQYDPDLPWRDMRGDGFNAQIGPIGFAELGDNRWCASLELDARHINVGGVCHGGVLLSLADVAMGAATFAAGGGRPCATIQLDAHFLAAAKSGQRLLALATQLRKVRELSFMQCEIWSGERHVLRASGTWKYLASGASGATGSGAVV